MPYDAMPVDGNVAQALCAAARECLKQTFEKLMKFS